MFDGKSSGNAGNLIGRSKVYMMEEIFVPTQEVGTRGREISGEGCFRV